MRTEYENKTRERKIERERERREERKTTTTRRPHANKRTTHARSCFPLPWAGGAGGGAAADGSCFPLPKIICFPRPRWAIVCSSMISSSSSSSSLEEDDDESEDGGRKCFLVRTILFVYFLLLTAFNGECG